MTHANNNYHKLIDTLLLTGARKATKYMSPRNVLKATRIGRIDGRHTRADIRVTVGAPNFAERLFIKDALQAGVTFPIRKIQLKHPTKRT